MENQVKIFDTTLRDGEQSPGYSMNMDEKMRMANQLEDLQVDIIEAGFPIASDGDFETVKQISKEVKKTTVAGLCRTRQKDIQRAADALQPTANSRIHIFIATSDIHLKHKLKMSREEVLESSVKAVEFARDKCMEVEFSAEDASRSDHGFLIELFTAVIEAGASIINIPDTVGYALPWEYGQLIHNIRENIPGTDQIELSAHCHDDLGLAVANSITAVQNGASQIECTINGIGERAGNASLEEIVMCMSTRQNDFSGRTRIKTDELFAASQLLTQITGKSVQPNKAIVGENAFAHEAGIHQHGVLNNPMTYEIMTPESVGASGNRIVLGKHSGRFALNKKLQSLGYSLAKEDLNQVYLQFTKLADDQKIVSEDELMNLVANQPFSETAKTA
jgi:2-isopropylmalate synthase